MMSPFFAKLNSAGEMPEDDRALLEALLGDVRSFAPRRDVIREGDRPDHVHLMLEGWSCRYKILNEGTRQITAFLVPGDFCDTHITLFDEMDHSIGTLSDCRIAFIARDKMAEIIERPHIARALWWASLVDEAVLRAWIVNLGRRDAFERIGHLICEMHARLRNVGLAPEGAFELPLTQEELGDALGLTPIHISRMLKRLRDEKLLTFKNQRIVIADVARLRELVGFDPNYLHLKQHKGSAAKAEGEGA